MAKFKLAGISSPLRFDAAHRGGKTAAAVRTIRSPVPLEHFIPLRKAELIDRLCQQPGFSPADQDGFRRLCQLLDATLHFEYHSHFEDLKNAYAPFDSDADTQSLIKLSDAERKTQLDLLFERFDWLLERANFQRLSRDDLEVALIGRESSRFATTRRSRSFRTVRNVLPRRIGSYRRGSRLENRLSSAASRAIGLSTAGDYLPSCDRVAGRRASSTRKMCSSSCSKTCPRPTWKCCCRARA